MKEIPLKMWLVGGAAIGAVILGVFGIVDAETLKGWLEVIYGDATEGAE